MAWLLAALKKHQRRLKLENWLVLFLRCAALALLGMGLARWVVATRPSRGSRGTIVLLLDTSYSTGAGRARARLGPRARAADTLLAGLSADDVAAIVLSNDVRSDRTGTRPAVLLRAVGPTPRRAAAGPLVGPATGPRRLGRRAARVRRRSCSSRRRT
jgi:hypothetical protein